MEHRLKYLPRLCAALILTVTVIGLAFAAPQAAQAANHRVIRVGYTNLGSVTSNEDGTYSGYVVDYLNEVSRRTGWTYEFVLADTWADGLEMLKRGEVDLFGMVPEEDSHSEGLLYSKLPMAYNYTTLYTTADRDIYYQEHEKINGHTVGVVAENTYGRAFVEHARENSISCEIKTYLSTEEALVALIEDEIQFLAVGNLVPLTGLKVVGRFVSQPTYFMTSADNTELMNQLNTAMSQIKIEYPELELQLADTYHDATSTALHLTRAEREYIESAGPINIRMFGNRHPIIYYEGAEVKGVLPDYLDTIGALTGLKFNYIQTETDTPLAESALLTDGSILLTTHTAIPDTDLLRSHSIMQLDLAYVKRIRDNGDFRATTFALLENMTFLRSLFSERYTVQTYGTVEECMEAVMTGEADMTVQYELVSTYLLQKPKYASNLVEWVGSDYALDVYLYGPEEHKLLFSILDKTQTYLTDADRAQIVSSSLLDHTYVNQTDDFWYQYNWVIILAIMVLTILILVQLLRHRNRKEEEQLRENEALQRRLWIDGLTGLYNREGFFANARGMFAQLDGGISIARINICRFKQLNEMYGLENGDMILQEVGIHLKRLNSQAPMVLGRFSADYFYLCVASSDVEKLRFDRQVSLQTLSLDLDLTYGIYAAGQETGIQINVMCDRADLANDAAQPTEDAYIHTYSDAEHQRLRYEQMIERDMERALREDQFLIYIQPKYDVATEVIVGGEVLVRWLHPEHGLIPPVKFIDLFERNGFIRKLDYRVWEKCCQYIAEMKQRGIPMIPLSFNMSRIHFYSFESILHLAELLGRYDLDPRDVELEITESLCAEDPDTLFDKCRQLQAMGFRIAMDDFGSGYSSLSALKGIPIDTLKMDLRFLAGDDAADQSDRGHSILRAIIELAHTIGLDVVVEGLETREQRDFIREIGSCAAQGYYYARPMPTADFTELLLSGSVETASLPAPGTAANLRRERLRREQLQPLLELISVSENLFGYLLPEKEGVLSWHLAQSLNCPQRIPDLAEHIVHSGALSAGSVPQWMGLVQAVERGERSGSAIVEYVKPQGGTELHWFRFDTILDHEGQPLIAMFTIADFRDISAQVESLISSMQTQAEVDARRMQENEKLLSTITQHSDRVVCLYDVKQRTSRVWNREMCKNCQMPHLCETTLDGLLENEAFTPEGKDSLRQLFQSIDRGVSSGDAKVQIYSQDGGLRWVDILFSTICDDHGAPETALLSYKDITVQHEHEMAYLRQFQSLSETEHALGLMEVNLSMDRIELQDSLFAPIKASAVGGSMVDFAEQMITLKMREEHWEEARTFFDPKFMIHQHDMGNRLLNRTWPMTFLSGKQGWVRFDVELIADIYTGHIRAYFRIWDVTSIREKQLEIQNRSERDGMTGLYNRSTAEELIYEKLGADPSRGIFVILDLDRLKQINDGYGHSEGDKAIISVAHTLKSHFRGSDIIGRIGGDEFVIYLPGAAENQAVIAGTLTELLRKLGSLSVGENSE